MFITIIN